MRLIFHSFLTDIAEKRANKAAGKKPAASKAKAKSPAAAAGTSSPAKAKPAAVKKEPSAASKSPAAKTPKAEPVKVGIIAECPTMQLFGFPSLISK